MGVNLLGFTDKCRIYYKQQVQNVSHVPIDNINGLGSFNVGFLFQLYKMSVIESALGGLAMKTVAYLPLMFYCKQKSFHNRYLFLFWKELV